jgi:hypothetical protein
MWLFTRGNNEPDAASMASQGAFVAPRGSKAAAAKTADELLKTPHAPAMGERRQPGYRPR